MAMLAEPRRKQKWTLNPRGKHWSEDSNKFGQKMLEKMGWTSGKGLGANLDGMTEHIRARYKNDQGGIGFSHDEYEKQWTQHQEGYNELLQQLQNGETAGTSSKENELSGKSLELKSKQSRARLHYQKFTRGKDVNKYSTKDLANIFGKKDIDENLKATEQDKVDIEESSEKTISEQSRTSETSHGVITIKGGNITDYFKNKMSSIGRKTVKDVPNDDKNDFESENERYAGFGFAGARTKTEESIKSTESRNYMFENRALDNGSPREIKVTPGKCKKDYVFENPALELGDGPSRPDRTPKRRKSKFAFENNGLDLDSVDNNEETRNSFVKREKIKFARSTDNTEEIVKSEDSSINTESVESVSKKKRGKKSKERCAVVGEGYINDALNLETRDDDDSANIEEFEVPRSHFGLANDALDLTDESSGKKRVTFNETVEYETEFGRARGKKRKNKNAGKLDKFEVDNEKLKKKRKKERILSKEIVPIGCAFVNEAMDVEIVSQEANDNAANEKKIERARKKRGRRISSLETIVEAPEDERELTIVGEIVTLDESFVGEASENLGILTLGTPEQKKKRRRKDRRDGEMIREDEYTSRIIDENVEDVESIEEIRTTKMSNDENSSLEFRTKADAVETIVIVDVENTRKRKKKRKKESVNGDEATAIQVVEEFDEIVTLPKGERPNRRINEESRENVNKENVEVINENTDVLDSAKKRKKRKREKKGASSEKEETGETYDVRKSEISSKDTRELRDKSIADEWDGEMVICHTEMQNGLRSQWEGKARKSKTIFKALFAKSPVAHFAGSNINEIKGYGLDLN